MQKNYRRSIVLVIPSILLVSKPVANITHNATQQLALKSDIQVVLCQQQLTWPVACSLQPFNSTPPDFLSKTSNICIRYIHEEILSGIWFKRSTTEERNKTSKIKLDHHTTASLTDSDTNTNTRVHCYPDAVTFTDLDMKNL